MASALDFFQNVGGPNRPNEGLGAFVVVVDVISYGQDEFFQIAKHSGP